MARALIFDLSDYAFADVGNLEHCIKYLNQTLVTFGFPASLDLFANDPVSFAWFCCFHFRVCRRKIQSFTSL